MARKRKRMIVWWGCPREALSQGVQYDDPRACRPTTCLVNRKRVRIKKNNKKRHVNSFLYSFLSLSRLIAFHSSLHINKFQPNILPFLDQTNKKWTNKRMNKMNMFILHFQFSSNLTRSRNHKHQTFLFFSPEHKYAIETYKTHMNHVNLPFPQIKP